MPWFCDQPLRQRRKRVFQQDNAPAHKSAYIRNWLQSTGFKSEDLMIWPANSPGLNPIENYWSIIKILVYRIGKEFHIKEDLWKGIQVAAMMISPAEIRKLTSSLEKGIFEVMSTV